MFRLKRGPRTTQPRGAPQAELVTPNTILHLFESGARDRELARGAAGALTGAPSLGNAGLVTSSGNYLTASSSRAKFAGSLLTVIARFRLDDTTNTIRALVGTSGDTALRLEVVPNPGINLTVRPYVYIAGSLRDFGVATISQAPAVGDIYTVGLRFRQPDSQPFIRKGDVGSFTYGSVAAFGAAINETGAALLFGTNSANTQPFPGAISYFLAEERYWTNAELDALTDWPSARVKSRRIWVPSAGGGGASSAALGTTGATGAFSGTAQTTATATLATTGGTGTFAAAASSPAVAALAVAGGIGDFSGTANGTTTATLAAAGASGTFAGAAGASTSVSVATAGGSATFAATANSITAAVLATTGNTGTFAATAGSGTSASLAVEGGTGTFAATASAPASVALAALGGEGAFAGSAYPLTTAQVAAFGQSGTFSGVASTVGTASLAVVGDSGGFAGSAISIGSAYLAALGESGTFAGSASVAAPSTVGRPASDISNSGWAASAGSDLYAMLDEVTPAPSDYIVAASVGAVCEVALNPTSYPGTAAQILKFRASSSTGNSVIVRLRNVGGATVRSATQALTASDTEYSITLTAGEIAAITSGALSVQLESA